MTRSNSSYAVAVAAAAVAMVALVIVTAVGVGRAAETADPSPSAPPVATPSPSPSPSGDPTPAPSDAADGQFDVILDVADPHDVSAEILDETGTLVGARSGRAGDGMSVRWFDVAVENLDADTLRVTWVSLPYDAEIEVRVFQADEGLGLRILQSAPPENSDAIGFDRVLVLDFSKAVRASDVQATLQDGLDTAA